MAKYPISASDPYNVGKRENTRRLIELENKIILLERRLAWVEKVLDSRVKS
jgi:hypothetical protein